MRASGGGTRARIGAEFGASFAATVPWLIGNAVRGSAGLFSPGRRSVTGATPVGRPSGVGEPVTGLLGGSLVAVVQGSWVRSGAGRVGSLVILLQ